MGFYFWNKETIYFQISYEGLSSWMVNDSNQDAHLYLLKIRQDYSKLPPYTFTLLLPK